MAGAATSHEQKGSGAAFDGGPRRRARRANGRFTAKRSKNLSPARATRPPPGIAGQDCLMAAGVAFRHAIFTAVVYGDAIQTAMDKGIATRLEVRIA
jgi:hypothetical protein